MRRSRPQTEYDWKTRIDRAFTQRIYLLEVRGSEPEQDADFHFRVMGNSGEAYDITIDSLSLYCSCPDHTTRGNFCKHLMFVLIRACGMPEGEVCSSYYVPRQFDTTAATIERCRAFLTQRAQGLADINFQPNPVAIVDDGPVVVDPRNRVKKPKAAVPIKQVERKPHQEDSCPICCEDFADTPNEETLWCRISCGKSVHQLCFMKWSEKSRAEAGCVYCRGKWLWA